MFLPPGADNRGPLWSLAHFLLRLESLALRKNVSVTIPELNQLQLVIFDHIFRYRRCGLDFAATALSFGLERESRRVAAIEPVRTQQ